VKREGAMLREKRLFFLGAGSMAEAMVRGIIGASLLPAQQITMSTRTNTHRLEHLSTTYGVNACQDKELGIPQADIVVLAVKPFDMAAALREVCTAISSEHLVISVAAGVSTSTIESVLNGNVPIIRAMPNTSCFVQASATAISRGMWASSAHLATAQQLFSAIGRSVLMDESLLDAVTGLSGTGPAYFYYVMEALIEAGVSCGLPEETCRALLLQTVEGAAKMLKETRKAPAELRRQVTSPNGTTMAAMSVLEQGGSHDLFVRAVQHATARAADMEREASVLALLSSGALPDNAYTNTQASPDARARLRRTRSIRE
jgi:pyrroline-5-carboxylate reductase